MSMAPDPTGEIRQLFRGHVPEVSAGTVEIVSVARDVGRRSYIAGFGNETGMTKAKSEF